MLSRLFFLLICGNIAEYLGNAKKLPRAKRQSLKVQINATEDTIAMKFLRPSPNMQLEGFIMGYGSNIFSSQYIQLPAHGKSYETEIDAEPRYLISVKPVANPKKSCSGKNSQKPLQVVVGTLSPTSVFLSWGVLINPQHDWTVMNNCPNDRFYTVRFREKDKTKKWHFQLCPATETLIENLKPNTIYEFGVKDNSEDGVWTKAVNHQTSMPSKNKENGQIQNTYKIPKGQILMAPEDMKKLITIQVIKQVIQNITNMKPLNPKPTVGPSPPEATPGHKKILHGVPEPTKVEVLETPKPKLAVAERAPENIKATVSTGLDLSKAAPAHIESKTRSLKPDSTSSPQPPVSTRATVQTFLRPSAPKVPYKVQYDLSSPENSKKEEISQPESATNSPDLETTISLITSTPQVFRTASAGNVAHPLPARPKPSDHLHLQDTKSALDIPQVIPEATMRFTVSTTAATSQTTLESIPSENLPTLEWVRATRVSNETPFVPSKADQSASPEAKPVTSTLKMSTATHQTPQEPAAAKTATILREPKLTMGKEAPIETQFTHSPPIIPTSPETSPAAHPQPPSSKTSVTFESPQATLALTETYFIAPKPIAPASSEKPQHKPATTSQTLPGTILAPALTSERPTITLGNAISEKLIIPSLPKASVRPEMSHTKPATISQTLPGTILAPAFTSEQPAVTLDNAISENQLIPSLPKAPVKPEMSFTKPAASQTRPGTILAPALTSEQPAVTLAITDKQLIPSLPKASVRPEMSHTKPVAASQTRPGTILAPALSSKQPTVTLGNVISEKQLIPSLPKASVKPEMSHTKPAPTESLALPSKPKITSRPEIPQTKPAKQIVLDSKTSKAAEPRTTLAPKEKTYFQSEPEMSPKPDMSQHEPVSTSLPITKPVTAKSSDTVKQEQSTQAAYRKILYPLTTKSPLISERRRTTTAPKTIHLAPSKPKPSSRPGAPQTKPVPNETQKLIEPETTQIPESPGPKKTPWAPINLKRLNIFEDPRIPLFANETEPRIVPSSSKPKTRQTTKTPYTRAVPNATQKTSSSVPKTTVRPHSRSAPSGIITEPVMSKLPVPPQRPKATLGPYKVRSPRPRTSARPWIRPVDGTTQGSIRTKPLDESNWLPGNTNNGRLVGLDISKPLGVSRNTSMEPNNTRKGLVSGPSPPQRVFPPPTQHTYTRRRPYPFHNVTGRPGGPGTVMPRTMRFTAKPTQFSVAQKTQMPMKQTTFSASELDDANDTIFNPKPKSELDPQGKSRFTASHVKYIRKDDRVPCSITESLKHFPAEQASNQDITSPPQNPPSNLTVVTVEGCSSFVILDWEQPDNDTVTEYEVISRENGGTTGHDQSILTTNQTYSTVENLKPDTSYEFKVKPRNPLGEGPTSNTVEFSTESADPRVSEFISGGKDAIWTELSFKSDGFSECKGKQYVKRTWYKKFVGIQLCNSLRYKIYLSDSLTGNFYNIGDQTGHGEDHCQFVDSFLDGRTGQHLLPDQLPTRKDITSAGRFTLYRSAPHHSFVSTCLSEQPEHSLEMVVQTSLFGSSDSLFGN
ncbi:target of Nesh-SH3 isoform X9 [Microcaecilia unicolor]|uniref:Target of Nesh-SH3 isoform X9 n=1 Tax=Microcaecilia unicolor TaxID=1415580 RepID=A0A6P7XX02_9AMPH|nr:target of Nesh-SH3 isoform X9 [Microcaecilia unicolor]